MIDSISLKLSSLALITAPIIVVVGYFCQETPDLYQLKYILTAFVTFIAITTSLFYQLTRGPNKLIYTIPTIPILTLGSSVYIIKIDEVFISIFFIFWTLTLLISLTLTKNKFALERKEKIFWTILFFFIFSRLTIALTSNISTVSFFTIDYVGPVLFFSYLFIIRSSNTQQNFISQMIKSNNYLIFSVISIILIEIIARSGGEPWRFLLHGARRLYAGTQADVTGGMGEPVTLGLWAASTSILYYVLLEKKKLNRNNSLKMIFILTLISFFSTSRSSAIVSISLIIITLSELKLRKITLLIFALILFYLIWGTTFSQRITDSHYLDIAVGDIKFGNNYFSTELNLAIYLNRITSWFPTDTSLPWYLQIISLPFFGGEQNIKYANNTPLSVLFINGIALISLMLYATKTDHRSSKIYFPYILLFIMILYYGAFGTTSFDFYYLIKLPEKLGYIPRAQPFYLFLFFIVSFFYIRNQPESIKGKTKEIGE